jgi:hypothetical protein
MNETQVDSKREGRGGILTDLPDGDRDRELLKGDKAIFELPEVKDIPGQEFIKVMPLGEMGDTTIASDDEEGVGILDFDEAGNKAAPYGADEENSVVIDTEEAASDEDDGFIDDEEDDEEDDDEEDEEVGPAGSLDQQDTDGGLDEPGALDDTTTDTDVTPQEIDLLDQGGPVERDSDTDNLNRSKLDDTDMDGEPLNESTIDGEDLDVPGAELDDNSEELGEEDEENNIYSEADTE